MIVFLFLFTILINLCFSYHVYGELNKRNDNENDFSINYSVKDAFIEVCNDNGKCEKIFEDDINGGHDCTVAIFTECPITPNYNKSSLHLLCDNYTLKVTIVYPLVKIKIKSIWKKNIKFYKRLIIIIN